MPISSAMPERRCAPFSALDIALWDLFGQHTGQPICNLLGGRTRDDIRVYNTCVDTPMYRDQEGFLSKPGSSRVSLLDEGITQMKIWPWDRFAPQLKIDAITGPAGGPRWGLSARSDARATGRRSARGVGNSRRGRDRMQIAIEGIRGGDLNCAMRIARALEPYDVVWMGRHHPARQRG